MSITTLVPLSEYLSTSYRPDCDFLEGELKERNMGEMPHGRTQLWIAHLFLINSDAWGVRPITEQRVQVSSERFRVPDICIQRSTDPLDPIVRTPPLLCIEVLSSSDSLGSLQERVNDYVDMGVPHIWIVDPWSRTAYYASRRGFELSQNNILRIEGSPIEVHLDKVFAKLDS
jgi:Uma2 family endonuclease